MDNLSDKLRNLAIKSSDNNQQLVPFKESLVHDEKVSLRLLKLIETTHYQMVQENGQRRITSPDLTPEVRDKIKGAEIFIGKLPRDCYEDELMPILMNVGKLMELRMMLDFSGTTRGYAFALYENSKVARLACKILDNYLLRPGHKIGVVKSVDNCRLFFGGVPKDKRRADFLEELGKILDGISDIYVYPNIQNRSQNRGFIFVEFKDHRSAAMARRKLIPGKVILWDHEIAVDWAVPEPGDPIDDDMIEKVSALYVRNIPLELAHQNVRDIFQKATGVPIIKLKKIDHFAFVHYESRELAKKVYDMMILPGSVAQQNDWEVQWAKPISMTKMMERQRSINEALQLSESNGTNKKTASRYRGYYPRKRGRDNPNHYLESLSPDSDESKATSSLLQVDYKQLLKNFAYEKFRAQCHFVLYQYQVPQGITCWISLIYGNQTFLEFAGPIQTTEAEAVYAASRDFYLQLKDNFYYQMQPPQVYSPTDHLNINLY